MTKKKPKTLFLIKDLYRSYCRAYTWKLSESKFRIYLKLVMGALMDYVIEGGYMQLPYNLGSIFIERNKPNYFYKDENGNKHLRNSMINWKETIKLRKEKEPNKPKEYWLKFENRDKYLVTFTNFHTDGYIYAIRHRFDILQTINKSKQMAYYIFKPYTGFKKKLGHYLLNNKKIPTYYDKFNKYKFDYREIAEKIAKFNKRRQGERYRKYLDSIEVNRNKTN